MSKSGNHGDPVPNRERPRKRFCGSPEMEAALKPDISKLIIVANE